MAFLTIVGILVLGFLLQFELLIKNSPILGFFLFAASVLSIFMVFPLWKRFSPYFAPWVISFSTQSWIGRKIISGGSFVYSEYEDNPEKIGLFHPIGRFISLAIAFLGVATSLVKIATRVNPAIRPESPTEDMASTIGWIVILIIVPIMLTPVVPVIWTMEDLRLKAWHKGKRVCWRVADRYRMRFNGFIALSAVTAGLSLSSQEGLEFLDNVLIFLQLLASGMILLTFPLGLLVASYYLYFRGELTQKTLDRLDVPIALTELIYDVEGYRLMEQKLRKYEEEERKKQLEAQKKERRLERKNRIRAFFRLPPVAQEVQNQETDGNPIYQTDTQAHSILTGDGTSNEEVPSKKTISQKSVENPIKKAVTKPPIMIMDGFKKITKTGRKGVTTLKDKLPKKKKHQQGK